MKNFYEYGRLCRLIGVRSAETMKYEVRPMDYVCFVYGSPVSDFEISFEDTDGGKADVFSVYGREADGSPRWVADFGDRIEAEKWKEAAERSGL
jgi:hypothetical protein